MKLQVLGSGSKGSCYILSNENEVLIIEAGIKISEVKEALNFDFSKVVGLLITHEHVDHAKYMSDFMGHGINIYASSGTHNSFIGYGWNKRHILKVGEAQEVGNFNVTTFDTIHDCAEPVGFIIEHADFGKLVFCTDTKVLPFKFKGLNHILVEANYSFDLIKDSSVKSLRNRVFQEHMEIGSTIDFLKNNDLSQVNNIVLLHLSDSNSDAIGFVNAVQPLSSAEVYIAESDLEIELSIDAF